MRFIIPISKGLFVFTIVHMCAHFTEGTIIYDDGGVRSINTLIQGSVTVSDNLQGDFTTVNLFDGASVGDLGVHNYSQVNMYGGIVRFTMAARNNSHIDVSGGTIDSTLTAEGDSTVTVSGGWVGDFLAAWGNGHVTVTGGYQGQIAASNNGRVDIFGGVPIYNILADDQGQMFIYGHRFNYPYGKIVVNEGVLIGNLQSGVPIECPFHIYNEGSITLVPEPASICLLAFFSLSLVGWGLDPRGFLDSNRSQKIS